MKINAKLLENNGTDRMFLYQIRNNVEVRATLIKNSHIDWFDHIDWFNNYFIRKDQEIYILSGLMNDKMIKVGYVNILFTDECVEIGVKIDPVYQGRGFGTESFDFIFKQAKLTKKRIILTVFDNNVKAIKMYEKKGFRIINKSVIDLDVLLTMEYKPRLYKARKLGNIFNFISKVYNLNIYKK